MALSNHLDRALKAQRESKYIEFKEGIDLSETRDWCEIIKDLVAISNNGGGVIVIGLNNVGQPSGFDVEGVLTCDPAIVTDKVKKYTGYEFTEFEISECTKDGHALAAFVISESTVLVPFVQPGTYPNPIDTTKQKTAFARGTVYTRHGAKSEPATRADMRDWLDRRLDEERARWQSRVRQVIEAPLDSHVIVAPGDVKQVSDPAAPGIQIVADPTAPAYQLTSPDDAFPFRQKEVIQQLKKSLPKGTNINQHVVQAINLAHDCKENPAFAFKSKYGTTQYSQAYLDWIIDSVGKDPDFISKSKQEWYQHHYDSAV